MRPRCFQGRLRRFTSAATTLASAALSSKHDSAASETKPDSSTLAKAKADHYEGTFNASSCCREPFDQLPTAAAVDDRKFSQAGTQENRQYLNHKHFCKTSAYVASLAGPAGAAGSRWGCTSCNSTQALAIRYPLSNVGICWNYSLTPKILCARTDGNHHKGAVTDYNRVCTKVSAAWITFSVHHLNQTAKRYYSPVRGTNGLAVAKCAGRKETICRGSACSTRKQIQCLTVCKKDGVGPRDHRTGGASFIVNETQGNTGGPGSRRRRTITQNIVVPRYSDCKTELCQDSNPMSTLACKEFATMF